MKKRTLFAAVAAMVLLTATQAQAGLAWGTSKQAPLGYDPGDYVVVNYRNLSGTSTVYESANTLQITITAYNAAGQELAYHRWSNSEGGAFAGNTKTGGFTDTNGWSNWRVHQINGTFYTYIDGQSNKDLGNGMDGSSLVNYGLGWSWETYLNHGVNYIGLSNDTNNIKIGTSTSINGTRLFDGDITLSSTPVYARVGSLNTTGIDLGTSPQRDGHGIDMPTAGESGSVRRAAWTSLDMIFGEYNANGDAVTFGQLWQAALAANADYDALNNAIIAFNDEVDAYLNAEYASYEEQLAAYEALNDLSIALQESEDAYYAALNAYNSYATYGNARNTAGIDNTYAVASLTIAGVVNAQVLPPAPTPEPATMLILGLGIAGLGIARRRFGR